MAVAVAGVVAGSALVVALVVGVGGSSPGGDGGPAERATSATTAGDAGGLDADASPAEVFAHAAGVLDEAGTFSYEGSSRIDGSGLPGGSSDMVVETELSGQVALPDSVRETINDPEGLYAERISLGSEMAARSWMRDTAYPDQIAERPWAEMDWPGGALEPYLLPEWLAAAVDHRDGGEDANGRRVVHAGVPARLVNDLGPDMDVIDVAVELTLGDGDEPRQVTVEVSTSDVIIESSYELGDVGGDVSIEAPTPDQLDATPWVNEQDLAAFDGPAPLGLSSIPEGWELSAAYVTPDPVGGCSSVTVDYTDLSEPVAEYLWLDVFDAGCATAPLGEPLEVAGYTGAVGEEDDGSRWGVVTSGDTAVSFSTDLSVGDLRLVLANLVPLDPAVTPEPMAGIPSSGT